MGGSVGVSSPPVGRPRAAQWGDRELPSGEGAGAQWRRAATHWVAPLGPSGSGNLAVLRLSLYTTQYLHRHLMCPSHLVGLTFLRVTR